MRSYDGLGMCVGGGDCSRQSQLLKPGGGGASSYRTSVNLLHAIRPPACPPGLLVQKQELDARFSTVHIHTLCSAE